MSLKDPAPTGEAIPPAANAATLAQESVRLPLARPIVTYILLAIIVVVFVADVALEQITGQPIVFILGAQINTWVGAGEYWRLLTSIFLHGGLTHLAFNSWALYVLGRDLESFYGHVWFTAIYVVSGLAGNVAWYVLGSNVAADVPSVGASGAIFGLIGAEVAYFMRNRAFFGAFGRQRLANLVVLIAINLVFGFAVPNINNFAHLGGLTAGFLLGLALAPRYAITWSQEGLFTTRSLVDVRPQGTRVIAVVAALLILFGLILVGNQRWAV